MPRLPDYKGKSPSIAVRELSLGWFLSQTTKRMESPFNMQAELPPTFNPFISSDDTPLDNVVVSQSDPHYFSSLARLSDPNLWGSIGIRCEIVPSVNGCPFRDAIDHIYETEIRDTLYSGVFSYEKGNHNISGLYRWPWKGKRLNWRRVIDGVVTQDEAPSTNQGYPSTNLEYGVSTILDKTGLEPTSFQLKWRDRDVSTNLDGFWLQMYLCGDRGNSMFNLDCAEWKSFVMNHCAADIMLVEQAFYMLKPIFYGMPLAEAGQYLGVKKLRQLVIVYDLETLLAAVKQIYASMRYYGVRLLGSTREEDFAIEKMGSENNRYLQYCREVKSYIEAIPCKKELQNERDELIAKITAEYDAKILHNEGKRMQLKDAYKCDNISEWRKRGSMTAAETWEQYINSPEYKAL